MSATDPEPSTETAAVTARPTRWWIAAIAFVAGIIVGIVVVGLLSLGKPDFLSAVESTAPGGTATPSGGGSVPVVAQATVNAACLNVINEAQDVYAILTDLPQAITDVDLQQLDDIVRRLQPIEPRLGRDLQDCEVDTSISGNQTATPSSPIPTPATPTR